MEVENEIKDSIKRAIDKERCYIRYFYNKESKKGELSVDGESFDTPLLGFSEVADIVKGAFQSKYKVENIEPIGFRGEIFYASGKSLEIFATGSAGILEFYIETKKREAVV